MTSTKIKTITSCRVCGEKELLHVLSLGNHFVSNFVDSGKEAGIKVPLEIVLCSFKECSLLQLRHTTPSHMLYHNYWYKSGVNKTMRDALADISGKAEKIGGLKAGDLVLDIGCNDGTLLRSYKTDRLKLVGFDPAENLLQFSSVGTTKIFNDFFNAKIFNKEFPNTYTKVITSIAMFYDLDDPNSFVSGIKKCLAKDGIWVIQMSYLPLMLKQNAFDNLCHEHLEYYSLHSLKFLLEKHALKIFDTELNDINGGSFRVYVKHKESKKPVSLRQAKQRIKRLHGQEKKLGLDSKKPYELFAKRVQELKKKAVEFIIGETKKGKKVYVYGASTKGNTLLQFYGLDNTLIQFAVERNPDKFGKKTIGTLIPIISEEQARKEKPDYFLVLPWHFLKEFISREADYLKAGGKFIVPLPEFKVIGKEALADIK